MSDSLLIGWYSCGDSTSGGGIDLFSGQISVTVVWGWGPWMDTGTVCWFWTGSCVGTCICTVLVLISVSSFIGGISSCIVNTGSGTCSNSGKVLWSKLLPLYWSGVSDVGV